MVNKHAVTMLALGLLTSGVALAGSGQAAGDLPAVTATSLRGSPFPTE